MAEGKGLVMAKEKRVACTREPYSVIMVNDVIEPTEWQDVYGTSAADRLSDLRWRLAAGKGRKPTTSDLETFAKQLSRETGRTYAVFTRRSICKPTA